MRQVQDAIMYWFYNNMTLYGFIRHVNTFFVLRDKLKEAGFEH